MKKLVLTGIFMLALVSFNTVSAQLLSIKQEINPIAEDSKDWAIYTDNERGVVYVDFEKIDVNLSTIAVINESGKEVFKDDHVWELPVNTIYEVDCSKFPKGNYTVELKTFTSSVKRKISVK